MDKNRLYFGDCLSVLKELHREQPEGFIDLIYIDPPFNSKRNYNVLFESIDLEDANAQKQAFADTWSNYEYVDTINEIAELDRDLYTFLKTLSEIRVSDSAVAYLSTMAIRIHYIHKVLKNTGSFYLHCDPNMSHYLKVVCDLIFGESPFANEIVWKRSDAHSDSKQGSKHYGRIHDVILFYRKSSKSTFNTLYNPLPQSTIDNWYKHIEESTGRKYNKGDLQAPGGAGKGNPYYDWHGHLKYWRYSKENMQKLHDEGKIVYSSSGMPYQKRYLDESKGISIQDWWDDISMLRGLQKKGEGLGYPTQKPEALLERIIKTSSNEGDLVADFFCGCGTTVSVAQRLNRKWIGADISHLAVRLIKKRLHDAYGYPAMMETDIFGFPEDVASARMLAEETEGGRYSFQDWAIEVLLGGVVNPKKSADGGYDGYLTFELPEKKEFILIETKSGKVDVKRLREFIQVVQKQKAAMGIYVCFADTVTKDMVKEAKEAGYYDPKVWGQNYPKIQICTVEELLKHQLPKYPLSRKGTFKSAEKAEKKVKEKGLFD